MRRGPYRSKNWARPGGQTLETICLLTSAATYFKSPFRLRTSGYNSQSQGHIYSQHLQRGLIGFVLLLCCARCLKDIADTIHGCRSKESTSQIEAIPPWDSFAGLTGHNHRPGASDGINKQCQLVLSLLLLLIVKKWA